VRGLRGLLPTSTPCLISSGRRPHWQMCWQHHPRHCRAWGQSERLLKVPTLLVWKTVYWLSPCCQSLHRFVT
jgi:hypothetical protein